MLLTCIVSFLCALTVESATMSVDKVLAVRSFETSNTIVVTALTEPIFSHNENYELKEQIKFAIRDAGFTKRVIVSFDLDIYSKIKADMSNEEKLELIEILENRQKQTFNEIIDMDF